jgi:hypothetical protein
MKTRNGKRAGLPMNRGLPTKITVALCPEHLRVLQYLKRRHFSNPRSRDITLARIASLACALGLANGEWISRAFRAVAIQRDSEQMSPDKAFRAVISAASRNLDAKVKA